MQNSAAIGVYARALYYKKYDFDPPFFGGARDHDRGTDHFLNLHLENPEAFKYYTSQFGVVAELVGRYPILHHELVNEVRYNSYWPGNVVKFQDRMEAKYGGIASANRAWSTKFASFGDVLPPITVDPGGFYWLPETAGRGWRNGPLLADWSEFMAEHGAGFFRKLRATAEEIVGRDTLFTIQSPYSLGDKQLIPKLKAESEDVYGQEAFFYLFRTGSPGQEDWPKVLALMNLQYRNDIVRNASPNKPIVNLEAPWVISQARFDSRRLGVKEPGDPAGPNFMRLFFWSQLAHGLSGSIISYFYVNECSHGGYSVWDPKVMTRGAVREIPRVRTEINDLASVVMPRPRIRGKLAVVN